MHTHTMCTRLLIKSLGTRLGLDLKNNKPVKRFQMKSNGCRDVGLQSTQTRRNTGKQGAQTRATHLTHLPKHPYISGCMIIVGYANQFKVEKNFVVRHAVQPLM